MKQQLLRVVFFGFFTAMVTGLGWRCSPVPEEMDMRDSAVVAEVMANATLKADSGLFDEVKPYLDTEYRVRKLSSPYALFQKYEKLAGIYYFRKNDTTAVLRYLDSMSILMKKGHKIDPNVMIGWYFFNGHVSTQGKRFDEAFRYYYRGKRMVDSLENGCGNVRYYNTLAMILYRQRKYAESKEYFRKTYEYADRCNTGNETIVAETQRNALSNVGICCENLAQYDSAIYYYDSCLMYTARKAHLFTHNQLALVKFKGVVYGNRGGALARAGRHIEAEADLKQGIAYNDGPQGEPGDVILSRIKLAGLYLETGRYSECHRLIEMLEESTLRHPYLLADVRFADLKHRYYSRISDYSKAYASVLSYIAHKNEMDANTSFTVLTSADHVKEFEGLEKRYELELLRHRNEIKNRYLILSIAMGFMAVVIVVLLLVRRRASKAYIDELTRLNERVQKSNDKLQQSLRSLQLSQDENAKIMKVVAHDLRSPIAGIMSLVRLIKVDDLTREELNEYIDLVEKSGTNALSFIEDLLYINRSGLNFETKETDMQQLIESCVSIMQAQASRKGQTIRLSAPQITAIINEEKIWRVINNLLSNAIKFSPEGTMIEVKAVKQNNAVIVSVKDEGMGIPGSLKGKIFDVFSGAGRPGTSGEQSFGLGLSISRQIVDAHHGKTWFESEVGKGTTFYIELPLTPPH